MPKGSKVSPAHKRAMQEGRKQRAAVDAYLKAINTPKRRGRKVSKADLERRLREAEQAVSQERGADRVLAAQRVRDLQRQLDSGSDTVDVAALEKAFVEVAADYGESKGISYGAWRDAGVPAEVLKKAGIRRTRG